MTEDGVVTAEILGGATAGNARAPIKIAPERRCLESWARHLVESPRARKPVSDRIGRWQRSTVGWVRIPALFQHVPTRMKLCYVLLVHHQFDQALRLVGRLVAPGVSIVVHIDKKVAQGETNTFKAALSQFDCIVYAPRIDARWGSYRQALAIMTGIQTAARGASFDRCVLLSGQDYPIASHADIVRYFRSAPNQEFLEAHPLDLARDDTPRWSPYYRFCRYHVWLGKRRFVLPGLRRAAPPAGLFHGSTWWALTREAIVYLAERFELDAAYRRYLRTGFLVDEVCVPSMLMNSNFAARVTGANVTFAEFNATSGAHPKTLELADADKLAASPKLFARKFDQVSSAAILDWLDARDGNGPVPQRL